MNPGEIQAIIALIAMAGKAGTELYLKLKAIGELGPNEQENIHKQILAGLDFDHAMKQRYADWRQSVGLPALPELPPPTGATAAAPVPEKPVEGSD